MIAFADDRAVLHNHAADHRIGLDVPPTALGQFERSEHVTRVGFIEWHGESNEIGNLKSQTNENRESWKLETFLVSQFLIPICLRFEISIFSLLSPFPAPRACFCLPRQGRLQRRLEFPGRESTGPRGPAHRRQEHRAPSPAEPCCRRDAKCRAGTAASAATAPRRAP